MKKVILSLIILFPSFVSAQSVDLSEKSGDFLARHKSFFSLLSPEATDVEVGYLVERSHEEENGPGEFDLNNFSLDLNLARALTQNSFLNYGGHYEARVYDFSGVAGIASTGSETLHRIALDFGAGTFINDDLLAHGQVTAGLHSNFEDLDSDAYKLFAKALLVYRFNPGVQFLAGISASEEFDDTSVFPLLGVRLLSTDGKMHISLTAPLSLRVAYNFTPASQLYAGYWITGNEYNVDINGSDFDIFTQDRRAGFGFMHWFNEHLNLTLETGLAIGGELEFDLPGAGSFSDGNLDDTFYANVRIGYSL